MPRYPPYMVWSAGMRWAFTEPGWIGFFASMTDGRVMLRHELRLLRVSPEDAADRVIASLRDWGIPQLTYIATSADLFPSGKNSGETIAQTFQMAGLPMLSVPDDRLNGWQRLRSWLAIRESPEGTIAAPSLVIHESCKYFLRSLPSLISDEVNRDDVMSTPDEYPASGARFFVMSRPRPTLKDTPRFAPDAVGNLVEDMRRNATRRSVPLGITVREWMRQ
jgi:hypothetical protein